MGDSHTSVQVADSVVDQLNAYPMVLSWRDGHWYLTTVPAEEQDLLGAEVTAIGGRSMAEVVETFGRVLSADNPVKLRRQYRQVCNVADYYAYLGLAKAGEPLALTLADGKTVSIAPMPYLSLGEAEIVQLGAEVPQPATARQKCNYCALPLSGQVYYIQYNVCQEDPALPMEGFAAQVQADLEAGSYSRVLVDLRNNGGGSDGVIWPLLSVLRQEMDDGTEVVGLIGEATFSSAIINAVELQEMGIPLVGEPASGAWTTLAPPVAFLCPTPASRLVSPPNTSTWAPCWTPTPDGAWSLWSRISPFPKPWRIPWRAETPLWSGRWPIRRRWNSGNTRMRRSPGGGSWGCCMLRPGPLPQRRRPVSRICWASSGSCRR